MGTDLAGKGTFCSLEKPATGSTGNKRKGGVTLFEELLAILFLWLEGLTLNLRYIEKYILFLEKF